MRARVLSRVMPALCTTTSTPRAPRCATTFAARRRRPQIDGERAAAEARGRAGSAGRRRRGDRGTRRARPRQPGAGGGLADAARGPGDQRHATLERVHPRRLGERPRDRVHHDRLTGDERRARREHEAQDRGQPELGARDDTQTRLAVAPMRPISLATLRTKPSSARLGGGGAALGRTLGRRPSTTTCPDRARRGTRGESASYSARRLAASASPLASITTASRRIALGARGERSRGATEGLAGALEDGGVGGVEQPRVGAGRGQRLGDRREQRALRARAATATARSASGPRDERTALAPQRLRQRQGQAQRAEEAPRVLVLAELEQQIVHGEVSRSATLPSR